MKKNVLWMTILMAVMTLNAMAQNIKTDSLTKIPIGSRVDFRMDFSGATIHDRTETEFAKYEKDWEIDKPSIVEKFRSSASITTNGFMICDVLLTNKQGTVFFNVENLKGNSDSFFTPGTKLARIKIWAALTGGALGKMMKSRM